VPITFEFLGGERVMIYSSNDLAISVLCKMLGKVENKCTGRSENSLPLQKESRGKSVRPSRKFREVCRD